MTRLHLGCTDRFVSLLRPDPADFFTKDAMQLLDRALVISRLDHCITRSWLDLTTPTNNSQFSHVTPLLRDLHWASCSVLHPIQDDGTAPVYLQTLVRPHAPARALRSTTSADRPVPPSLRANKVATLLCSGTSVVERTPDRCQDSRATRHLPQKTQDSGRRRPMYRGFVLVAADPGSIPSLGPFAAVSVALSLIKFPVTSSAELSIKAKKIL